MNGDIWLSRGQRDSGTHDKALHIVDFCAAGSSGQNVPVNNARVSADLARMDLLLFCYATAGSTARYDSDVQCPLLGVKRTCPFALQMSAYDPKRTK